MYIDPNAPPPEMGATRPSSAAPAGVVGASLNDIIDAANSGNLRVDPATGDATMRALSEIQDRVEQDLRRMARGIRETRLGGGYAQRIDQFNRQWTAEGDGSALSILQRFSTEVQQLKHAVLKCMETYQATDAAGARHLDRASEGW